MITIHETTLFYFGIPDPIPTIRGFSVIAAKEDFLRAEQGGKMFYLGIAPRFYRLTPVIKNVFGSGLAATDRVLNVPREDEEASAV